MRSVIGATTIVLVLAWVAFAGDLTTNVMPAGLPAIGASSGHVPQGGGETCASATVIPSLPYHDDGSTVGFANDYSSSCGGGGPDVVYAFTPAQAVTVDVSLCESSFDTVVYIYADICSGANIACDDDGCAFSGPSILHDVALAGGTTYYIVVDGWGGAQGSYVIDIFPSLECPPGATAEGEADCGLSTDTVNGGCNSTPEVFSPISCGDVICGTAGASGGLRDTDWYEITLIQRTELTWRVTPGFSARSFILTNNSGGPPDCGDLYVAFADFLDGGVEGELIACLPPGTWWTWVGPDDFNDEPCGVEYVAELDCVSCTDCNGNLIPDRLDPDADGDGVPDDCDLCPGTPGCAIVDADGCTGDSDGDTVLDGCDQCPGTTAGEPIDADGCSTVDDDGDGVNNDQDDCAGTPACAVVGADGCPLDGDDDGVADGCDDCPGTAAGDPVDADGCSTADEDGDGVLNDDDLCAGTPTCATNVNANGCAIDSDGDGNVDGCEPPAQTCCGSTGPAAPLGLAVGLLLLSRLTVHRSTRRRG